MEVKLYSPLFAQKVAKITNDILTVQLEQHGPFLHVAHGCNIHVSGLQHGSQIVHSCNTQHRINVITDSIVM